MFADEIACLHMYTPTCCAIVYTVYCCCIIYLFSLHNYHYTYKMMIAHSINNHLKPPNQFVLECLLKIDIL